MRKKKVMTVSEVLQSCLVGDVVSDSVRSWKIVDLDFDGAIVAYPYKWNKRKNGSSFELWSCGVESLAVIPNLHKVI